MLLRALIIFFFFVVNCYADFPPVHWTEFDTDPSVYPVNIIMPAGSLSTVSTGLVVTFTGGSGSESTTVSDTATIDLTLTGSDITGDVITLKDLVTTAPITGGTDNILVGADSDITIALTQLKDIVTTAPLTGGENDVLPGADADLTLAITVAKDIVAGAGLSGGEDNVLPGADADTTLTFDATELDALTWDAGTLTAITWTWNTDTTDPTMTFENSGMIGIGTTNPGSALDVVGTIEGDTLTESGNEVYNSTETPGGSLGGTWASPTIDDLFLLNTGDIGTGVYDFGGASSTEVENAAGDVTLGEGGAVGVDTTNKQFAVFDGTTEFALPLRHVAQGTFDLAAQWDVENQLWLCDLDTDQYPNGIYITEVTLDATVADPTTEFFGDLKFCDAVAGAAFPGANATVIIAMDSTTGNFSNATVNTAVAGGKSLYIEMDSDPVDSATQWKIKIKYRIEED